MEKLKMIKVIEGYKEVLKYIDPNTGSLMLQVILGLALGGLYYLRTYIRRAVNWVRRKK